MSFGAALRRLRGERGVSLAGLAAKVHFSKGYLSNIENGRKAPTDALAQACDGALAARGELIAAASMDVTAAVRDVNPWQTAELLARVQIGDASLATLECLDATVNELCCQYPHRDAAGLRAEAQGWLAHIAGLLRRPVGLRAHRELLVHAGWLALLIGCLEYDLGMRAGAEATRTAARQLGTEAQHSEILGWTFEMSAWFALTQGRYSDVLTAARAGQQADRSHSVVVQLLGQEAKALGRMGKVTELRAALAAGQQRLAGLPEAARSENHFVVDPDKWEFYAMDAYRLARDDDLAALHADAVLEKGLAPGGDDRSPMRMAEARLTLAVVAARRGDLEQAAALGRAALAHGRRSLPSLVLVAGELDSELHRRYPGEEPTRDFHDAFRALR